MVLGKERWKVYEWFILIVITSARKKKKKTKNKMENENQAIIHNGLPLHGLVGYHDFHQFL